MLTDCARSEHFLGIKTLQTIGALKRQLLELLSDGRFRAASGLRMRVVKLASRRAGAPRGSEVVDVVLTCVALSRRATASASAGGPPEGCGSSIIACCGCSRII